MAARVIAFFNQKGGVGKTTCAINVAAGLARFKPGIRVLLIDGDPQANATAALLGPAIACAEDRVHNTTYEVMMGAASIADTIKPATLSKRGLVSEVTIDVLPSHITLWSAEVQLSTTSSAGALQNMRHAIDPVRGQYHYIVIDCLPALGSIAIALLMASTEIIIPITPGFFPMLGVDHLLSTIRVVQTNNPELRILGILPTMVSARATNMGEEMARVLGKFPGLVLPAITYRAANIDATAAQRDIFAYKSASHPAVEEYAAVVREVINRG